MFGSSLKARSSVLFFCATLAAGCAAELDDAAMEEDAELDVEVQALANGGTQTVAVTSDGQILHSARGTNGTWTQFGDVEKAGGRSINTAKHAAIAGRSDGWVHVVAVGALAQSNIYHSLRSPGGEWTPFEWVNSGANTGNPGGQWARVAAADVGGTLHLLASNPNGQTWYATRSGSGNWTEFVALSTLAGRGVFGSIGAANVSGELHVCAVGENRVWHSIRRSSGAWTTFADVEAATGTDIGYASTVDCTGIGSALHLVATNGAGAPFHTVRASAGPWTPFGNIYDAIGSNPGFAFSVAAAQSGGNLQVLVTSLGRVYHTLRTATTGAWTPFGNVSAVAGQPDRAISAIGID